MELKQDEPTTSVLGMSYADANEEQGEEGTHPPMAIDDGSDASLNYRKSPEAAAFAEAISAKIASDVAQAAITEDEVRARLQEALTTIAAVNRQNEELRQRIKEVEAQAAAEAATLRPEGLQPGLVLQARTLLVDARGQGWWAVPDQCALVKAW